MARRSALSFSTGRIHTDGEALSTLVLDGDALGTRSQQVGFTLMARRSALSFSTGRIHIDGEALSTLVLNR